MIIEFRVENFRSIADEQVISFERGLPVGKDLRPRTIEGLKKELLPVTAIYGANASGKTNLLNAMAHMRSMILTSHNPLDLGGPVPVVPFKWAGWAEKPSLFEIEFVHQNVRYRYGFVADAKSYREEWLSAWPKGREQKLFVRDQSTLRIGEHFQSEAHLSREILRDNALFLTVAWQLNHPLASKLGEFFRGWKLSQNISNADVLSIFFRKEPSVTLHPVVVQLLKKADIGIFDVRMEHTERGSKLHLKHDPDDEGSWLALNEESDGTRALVRLGTLIKDALELGTPLLIDELESSLHPLLALEIIHLFNQPFTNPHHAQLIFTTHDTMLLGIIDKDAELRRDQIWFTEKNEKGQTTIFPLTEFKARKGENLQRGYLQGRFGAVPALKTYVATS